ncbi:hypothetical protein GCM10010341_32710 [Streptomyces noursei]|nr:hypothetical protein GCM10010341_32710 [Streptomyces noursei]
MRAGSLGEGIAQPLPAEEQRSHEADAPSECCHREERSDELSVSRDAPPPHVCTRRYIAANRAPTANAVRNVTAFATC